MVCHVKKTTNLESIGGGHHVPVRFRVVRDGLDAEHAAHFVHHVALLAVHHREGEGTRLLVFAFLGQLNQLAQPVVDHLDQGRVLFGVRPQELGVVGLQLGRQVRVADLQSDGEPAVALQRAALVVAFQAGMETGGIKMSIAGCCIYFYRFLLIKRNLNFETIFLFGKF